MTSKLWVICLRLSILVLFVFSINCTFDTSGLPAYTEVEGESNAYIGRYTCHVGQDAFTAELRVCFPPELNPNLGAPPVNPVDILADFRTRAVPNVEDMARTCYAQAFETVTCSPGTPDPAFYFFAAECDTPCIAEDLSPNCSNFDPTANNITATNAPGNPPVCLANSSNKSSNGPIPLAAGIFGRQSRCIINENLSTARIILDDNEKTSGMGGVVTFTEDLCPGSTCAGGMDYQFDLLDDIKFDGALGLASVEIKNVITSGATEPNAVAFSASGDGIIASNQTESSGLGTRVDDDIISSPTATTAAFVGTNSAPINVTADAVGKSCLVNGALVDGTVEEDSSLSVEVLVKGDLVNQPPTARAGANQTVECTSPDGAEVTLHGDSSSDPDGGANGISFVRWHKDSRIGPVVGIDLQPPSFTQGLGVTSYVLQVVDGQTQADEDMVQVNVVDSTGPSISTVSASPNSLWPPNGKLVPVTVALSASDACSVATPDCRIIEVDSNESVNGPGDGNTAPDWDVTGDLSLKLRAERSGQGDGRIYTLTLECRDDADNTTEVTTTVTVPKSRGRG